MEVSNCPNLEYDKDKIKEIMDKYKCLINILGIDE